MPMRRARVSSNIHVTDGFGSVRAAAVLRLRQVPGLHTLGNVRSDAAIRQFTPLPSVAAILVSRSDHDSDCGAG